MSRKVIIPVVLVLFVISIVAVIYIINGNDNVPVSSNIQQKTNNDTIDNFPVCNQEESTLKKVEIESEVKSTESETSDFNTDTLEKKFVIYDIVGDSNKLSDKQLKELIQWRKDAIEYATEYSEEVFINGQTEEKKICLTFDDGVDSKITPKVLDVLKQYNVKGSFFFIGETLERHADIVKRAFNEGHLVLNHSWSHPHLSKMIDENTVKDEILLTEDQLYNIIGKRPAIMRPPYGDIDKEVITCIANNNYKIVLWSIDTLDWSQREKDNIVNNIVRNVRPGDIVLMHTNDTKQATLDALPAIITTLKESGYEFVDVSEMLGIEPYK